MHLSVDTCASRWNDVFASIFPKRAHTMSKAEIEVISSKADNRKVEDAIRILTEAGLMHWQEQMDEYVGTLTVSVGEDNGEVNGKEWTPYLKTIVGEIEHAVEVANVYEVSRELYDVVSAKRETTCIS